uniref:RNA1 polyprotein n=1 Tax=Cederberg Conebush nepovirus TaxID=3115760 RepID=A0AAT9J7V3_9SECO
MSFACHQCKRVFQTRSALRRHLASSNTGTYANPVYDCYDPNPVEATPLPVLLPREQLLRPVALPTGFTLEEFPPLEPVWAASLPQLDRAVLAAPEVATTEPTILVDFFFGLFPAVSVAVPSVKVAPIEGARTLAVTEVSAAVIPENPKSDLVAQRSAARMNYLRRKRERAARQRAAQREFCKKKTALVNLIVKTRELIRREEMRQTRRRIDQSRDADIPMSDFHRAQHALDVAQRRARSAWLQRAKAWRRRQTELRAERTAKIVIQTAGNAEATNSVSDEEEEEARAYFSSPHSSYEWARPCLNLGARNFGVGRLLDKCSVHAKKFPELIERIVALCWGRFHWILPLELLERFVDGLCHISAFYPPYLLIQELDKICTIEELNEAMRAVEDEHGKFAEVQRNSNARAFSSLFSWIRDLGKKTGELASNSLSAIKDTILDGSHVITRGLVVQCFDIARTCFYEAFGVTLSHLQEGAEILRSVWNACRNWCNSIVEKFCYGLQVLGRSAIYGLLLLVIAGIISMVEKALASIGFLAQTGITLTMFTTLFISYLGIAALEKTASYVGEIRALLTGVVTGLYAQAAQNARHSFASDGRSGLPNARGLVDGVDCVIHAVAAIGSGLVNLKFDSLIYAGRLAAAFDQLRKGKDALRDFAAWLFEMFGRMSDKFTGRETVFFDELAAMVQVDVKGWIATAQSVLIEAETCSISSTPLFHVVQRLLEEGQKLQRGLSGTPRKLSMDFGALVNGIVKDLKLLHSRMVHCADHEGRRVEPFWVYIYGPSHCGKTNCMNKISKELCKVADIPYTVYHRNGREAHWNNYAKQSVIQIDDLSAVVLDPSVEGELINIVSSKVYSLSMAAIEDKGITCTSQIVVTSSNAMEPPIASKIQCLDAYYERIGAYVEMRRKPGAPFEARNPTASCQARLLDPLSRAPFDGEEFRDFDDVLSKIKDLYAQQRDKEEELLACFRENEGLMDPIGVAARDFVVSRADTGHTFYASSVLLEHGVHCPTGRYLCLDGKVYRAGRGLEPQLVEGETGDDYLERLTVETFHRQAQCDVLGKCRNSIVASFLRDLTMDSCRVLPDLTLGPDASFAQRSFFDGLALSEKLFLRLTQKNIDRLKDEKEENVYCSSAWTAVLRAACIARQWLSENGAGILLLLAGVLACLVLFYAFFHLFATVFGGNATISGAVGAFSALNAKAVIPSGGTLPVYVGGVRPRYSFAKADCSSDLPIAAELCVAMFCPRERFISGMQYKNRSVMLTRHQAMSLYEGDEIKCLFHSTGRMVTVRWHEAHMIPFEGSEIVVWKNPEFLDLDEKKYGDLYLEDKEQLPGNFLVTGYGLRRDAGDKNSLYGYETFACPGYREDVQWTVTSHIKGEDYFRSLPRRITFNHRARNDDCGALILVQLHGKKKIAGMLVAGQAGYTWADFLPNPRFATARGSIDYFPEKGIFTPGWEKLGYLPKNATPHQPKVHDFVAVPDSVRCPIPEGVVLKEPCIVSSADPRCPLDEQGKPLNVMHKAAVKKFTDPMEQLDQGLLEYIGDEMAESFERFFDADECLEDVSLELAINGVRADESEEEQFEQFVLQTSPGWPYVLDPNRNGMKGKHAYFEDCIDGTRKLKEGTLASERYEFLKEFCVEHVPELVTIECPKVECLKQSKVKAGDVRLFSILPLEFNLLWRQKTLAFTQFVQKHRHELCSQVGTNPYSADWARIYQRLIMNKESPVAMNCDYSCFDGYLQAQVMEVISLFMNRLYKKDTVEQAKQRHHLMMSLHGRKTIVGNQVYAVYAGMPSGLSLTVTLNGILNEILIRYAYHKLVPEAERCCFSKWVTLIVYGDDNLISVHVDMQKYFYGNAIQAELKKIGVIITDGSDKSKVGIDFKPLDQLDFLKRKFKLDEYNRVTAPLDLSAIFTSMYWVRPLKFKLDTLQKADVLANMDSSIERDVILELTQNAQVALLELCLHGREYFEPVYRHFVRYFPAMADSFRNWDACRAFHSSKLSGMQHFEPARVVDMFARAELIDAVRNGGDGTFEVPLCPQICVVGPFYNFSSCDLLLSFIPLRSGEFGLYIKPDVGMGNVAFPTVEWTRKFCREKYMRDMAGRLVWPLIREAVANGKRICFRDTMPHVASWVVAMLVADYLNMSKLHDSIYIYNNMLGKRAISLDCYFSEWFSPATGSREFFIIGSDSERLLGEMVEGKMVEFSSLSPILGGARARNLVNQAVGKGVFPCVAATFDGKKYHVVLACSNKCCERHCEQSTTLEFALQAVWNKRCGHGRIEPLGPRVVTVSPTGHRKRYMNDGERI